MPLTPVAQAVLQAMAEAGGPPMSELQPDEGRAVYRLSHQDLIKQDMHSVDDSTAGGVPVRIYRPNPDTKACLVFYHGGGWVIGDLETHDAPCRLLAKHADCVVIAVDYRLAPEHPFPAPFDDCYQATTWIAENAEMLNIDANKLAVGGDSAGGNLAAAVCLKARDESGPAIQHQLLVYPVTDGAMTSQSYTDNAEGYLLGRDTMTWFFDHYVPADQRDNPMVSPLKAANHQNLPPATVFTAEFDPLRDEGEAYGAALKNAGVETVVKRYDGQMHGFFTMTDVMPEALESIQLASEHLKRAFA